MTHPLFKDAMHAVKSASHLYTPLTQQKLIRDVLDALFAKYRESQRVYLAQKSDLGRLVTGDGATIMGTKFINYLCHNKMKGTMLLRVINCVKRFQDGVKVDAPFIAMEIMKCIKAVGHVSVLLLSNNYLPLFLITLLSLCVCACAKAGDGVFGCD